ncbi:DUF924-domain-containing protein [Aspergillus pseudoustus]|uniref:DUF924-domain-containing protein n=1 Tax=Aspergillus pseudoustus TaxID=1810923 RepID=A0ABR4KYI2_9EURO
MNVSVVIEDVYTFWFSHITLDEHLTLPTLSDNKRWFMRDAAFDQECRHVPSFTKFGPILTHLKQENVTKSSILHTFNPQTARAWLSLTILLDQLPRNCYRDAESAVVFTFFDPLAQAIAEHAINAGIPSEDPDIRYRLALRFWFYLPLIHSEDLTLQDRACALYDGMTDAINTVLDSPDNKSSLLPEQERKYCETLRSHRNAVEELCTLHKRVQKDHRDPIVRFGRFPHRNLVLGRISTPEEEKFLKEGKGFA